jgi:hypothetical protein
MKNWMRKYGLHLTECGLPVEAQLRMAMRSVGSGCSRHAFHEAQYI